MTVNEFAALIRGRTQTVGDTTKLPDARLFEILNIRYKDLRTQLQTWSPLLYLHTTGNLILTAADWIVLSSLVAPFEHLHKLEVRDYVRDGFSVSLERWEEVELASVLMSELHPSADIAWIRRSNAIYILPEGKVSGTFRVMYHFTPTSLASGSDTVEIPAPLNSYFVSKCAVDCYEMMRNPREAAQQMKRAEGNDGESGELGQALARLSNEEGAHAERAGLQQVQGF